MKQTNGIVGLEYYINNLMVCQYDIYIHFIFDMKVVYINKIS